MKRTNTEKTVSFWPVPSYERLRLGEQSARQGRGGELRFSSVKGAHASLQLVVQCDVPVTEISLAAEDLKNAAGPDALAERRLLRYLNDTGTISLFPASALGREEPRQPAEQPEHAPEQEGP